MCRARPSRLPAENRFYDTGVGCVTGVCGTELPRASLAPPFQTARQRQLRDKLIDHRRYVGERGRDPPRDRGLALALTVVPPCHVIERKSCQTAEDSRTKSRTPAGNRPCPILRSLP